MRTSAEMRTALKKSVCTSNRSRRFSHVSRGIESIRVANSSGRVVRWRFFGTFGGLSMAMGDWRFNLRMSNTEPVVRLNVESRGDKSLMESKTAELLSFLDEN